MCEGLPVCVTQLVSKRREAARDAPILRDGAVFATGLLRCDVSASGRGWGTVCGHVTGSYAGYFDLCS